MNHVHVIEEWVERFNRQDVDDILRLYADEATLHVAFTDPVTGTAAIRTMFEAYFAAAPLHCIVQHLYAGDNGRVVLEWNDRVGLAGINVYEIANGLILHQRNYFDQLSFLRLNNIPLPAE